MLLWLEGKLRFLQVVAVGQGLGVLGDRGWGDWGIVEIGFVWEPALLMTITYTAPWASQRSITAK